MVPSDEVIDPDRNKVLTYRNWLYFNDEVKAIANENGYQEMMTELDRRFQSDWLNLMNRIGSEEVR